MPHARLRKGGHETVVWRWRVWLRASFTVRGERRNAAEGAASQALPGLERWGSPTDYRRSEVLGGGAGPRRLGGARDPGGSASMSGTQPNNMVPRACSCSEGGALFGLQRRICARPQGAGVQESLLTGEKSAGPGWRRARGRAVGLRRGATGDR